jgi:uncharacterized BrkB/YihY/UPF0761 family membrane protein
MMWIWLSIVVILCGAEINEILDKGEMREGARAPKLPRKSRL